MWSTNDDADDRVVLLLRAKEESPLIALYSEDLDL